MASFMNPIEKLENSQDAFSRAELAAAKYILESPTSVIQFTLTDLAKKSHSSTAAIIRMCQRIGYDGYKDFKFSMSRYLIAGPADRAASDDSDQTNSLNYIANAYIRFIALLRDTIPMEDIHRLSDEICHAKDISIWGVNRTGFSAMQLSYRLARLGIATRPITDPMVMTDYASILGQNDLCIIFSIRGRGTANYADYMRQLRSQGCKVALLTMEPKLNLNKEADYCFVLPHISKTPDLSFLDDQAIYFVFIEALLKEVSKYYMDES
jgi:DNA-binding MurR/RpiR family transcriptional regulator